MNASAVLNKAADLIEDRGWFQGTVPLGNRLCANMALGEGANIRGDLGLGPLAHHVAYKQAQLTLIKHLDLPRTLGSVLGSIIVEWNDKPGRTLAEVATALRAAAKEAA